MKKVLFGLLACAVSLSAFGATPRTARDYYQELLRAHGIDPVATFVCFPAEEPQTFFLMGRSSQFLASLKAAQEPIDQKTRDIFAKLVGSNEVLYWQGYYKGVGTDPSLFEKGDTPREWSVTLENLGKDKVSGWAKVKIEWPTLRYRLSIHIDGYAGSTDSDGVCQPIHATK